MMLTLIPAQLGPLRRYLRTPQNIFQLEICQDVDRKFWRETLYVSIGQDVIVVETGKMLYVPRQCPSGATARWSR
jgi:hypothetical protein